MTDKPAEPAAKTHGEAAMETFVYAPIGLLFEGASLLPQLVEKGRQQVAVAKMMGKFAVDQATTEATRAAGKLQDQAAGVLDFIGGSVAPVPTEEPAPPAPKTTAKKKPKAKGSSPARVAARQVAAAATGAVGAAADAVEAATLAIPDYDGLSASHVVNRLAGLSASELEAVRAYELAHRGRKTILSKVAQLQSS